MCAANNTVRLYELHRQIEEAKNLIVELERKKSEIKRTEEQKCRERAERWRQLSMQPTLAHEVHLLNGEMQRSVAVFMSEIGQLNDDIRAVQRTIDDKKRECDRLF